MADIRRLTDQFWVSPQIEPADLADAAASGVRLVINNRPDGEAGDQPGSHIMEQEAKRSGMAYVHAPFVGAPTREAVEAARAALDSGKGPILAYCRSGTRSATAWALAEAGRGILSIDEIISRARDAGYQLGGMKGLLQTLAPR